MPPRGRIAGAANLRRGGGAGKGGAPGRMAWRGERAVGMLGASGGGEAVWNLPRAGTARWN
jgi:hypothetical protein